MKNSKPKMTIQEYDKKISDIDKEIENEANKAWLEIQEKAKEINLESRRSCQEQNEAPCSVCKKTEYVLKYREVVGKVEGQISGYFSLFGGSISGQVNGETHTNPVLSCRNCGNEKLVKVAPYLVDYQLLEDQMPAAFPSIDSYYTAKDWAKSKGIEVLKRLAKNLFCPKDYHDVETFSNETLKKCGLEYKYPLPPKPIFYAIRKALSK